MPARTATLWIQDLAGDGAGAIHDVLDVFHDETLDQTETLTFELAADHPKVPLIIADVEVRLQDRNFYVHEISRQRHGTDVTVLVECEALWYRLLGTTRVGSFVQAAVTAAAGLAAILDGTDWHVGGTTITGGTTFSIEEQDLTVLALVRRWATITGLAVVFDTGALTVDLVADRGNDTGVSFAFGRNVKSGRRTEQPPIATRLYGYGSNGLTFAGLNAGAAYLEDFSWYTDQGLTLAEARARFTRTAVFSDSSFIVDADLLAATTAKLAIYSQASTVYEADVVDISELTGVRETLRCGDTVTVTDPDLDLDERTIVVRYKRYPLAPWQNEIGLAFASDPQRDSASTSRPQTSADWHQFTSNNTSAYQLRNDARFILGRIPLNFRDGGQANFHVDIFATGVGAGTLTLEVYDATAAATVYQTLAIPYTDGQVVHENLVFALDDLSGEHDYRVRYVTAATGGAAFSKGVNIAAGSSRFFIMALGAVQETPTSPNSLRFDFTGAVQTFTVPDSVTEITIEAHGSAGATGTGSSNPRAFGAKVTATYAVVAGTVYDVYVGGPSSTATSTAGWPNGGNGGTGTGPAGAGGGSSHVVPTGAAVTTAIIVAGAGGGASRFIFPLNINGGAGGALTGADGLSVAATMGRGGTQAAGGAAGGGTATAGTAMQGGNGATTASPSGGGGGGGWFGGGGGDNAGGGGGGSSYFAAGFDVSYADGENAAAGFVIISWADPDPV